MTVEIAGLEGGGWPTENVPDASFRARFADNAAYTFFLQNAGSATINKIAVAQDAGFKRMLAGKGQEDPRLGQQRRVIGVFRQSVLNASGVNTAAAKALFAKAKVEAAKPTEQERELDWQLAHGADQRRREEERERIRSGQRLDGYDDDLEGLPFGLSSSQAMWGVAGLAALGIWWTWRRGGVF